MPNPKKSPSARRKRPTEFIEGNTRNNRRDRRATVAFARQKPALDRKQRIRDAHDKSLQRAHISNKPKKNKA